MLKDSIKDLYTFIDCLYLCGQYQRVLNIIKEKDLHRVSEIFVSMTAFVKQKKKTSDNMFFSMLLFFLEYVLSFSCVKLTESV